jgi:hypothetical protein
VAERFEVSTRDLRSALAPRIEALNAERPTGQRRDGGIRQLAAAAAPKVGIKPESMERRLQSILSLATNTSGANLADALLISFDTRLGEEGVPTFPRNESAALEMVLTDADLNGDELPLREARELARKLQRFASGYVTAELVLEQAPTAADRELAVSA